MKKIIVLVMAISVLIPWFALGEIILTDEEKYKINIKPKKLEKGITGARLIMFGHLIEPPYEVKIAEEERKVYVNGIPLTKPPRPKKPGTDEVESFEDDCYAKYHEWKKKYGKINAETILLNYIRTSPLVKNVEKEQKRIIINYANGITSRIWIGTRPKSYNEKEHEIMLEADKRFKELRKTTSREKTLQIIADYLKNQKDLEYYDVQVSGNDLKIYKESDDYTYRGFYDRDPAEGITKEQMDKSHWDYTKQRMKELKEALNNYGHLVVIYSDAGEWTSYYDGEERLKKMKEIMGKNVENNEKEKLLIENIDWGYAYKNPHSNRTIVKEIIQNFKVK